MEKFMSNKKDKIILVISDVQAPFHHKDTIPFLKAVKKKYKPGRVVNIGDLSDSYCLTAWQKSPESISANDEIKLLRKFTKEYCKVFPEGDILTSNHDRRLERAAVRAGIPKHFLKDYHEWMGLTKGWTFHDELLIDDIMFTHGEEVGAGGQHAALNRVKHYGRSCVSGHLHTQSCIQYMATRDKLMFGMQVGCLIDREALAFAYAKTSLRKPVLTVGLIINGVPMLIPMFLDSEGNWTRKI
jgi:metallophosphoesterase superfamily enzyme